MPIAFFIAISAVYFSPVYKGKVIRQGDITKFEGMSQELRKFYDETGETSCWTGAMFSGMPAYHAGMFGIGPSNYVNYLAKPFLAFDYLSMSIILVALIAF